MADLKEAVDCFNEIKELIMAIPDDKHVSSNMPFEEAMQEARRVAALVEKYNDDLTKSDIDPLFLKSISTRAGAYSYCVAMMDSFVKVGQNNIETYLQLKKEGYAIRTKIIKVYEYVFRNEATVLTTLESIREGRGDFDMIRDLLSLYILGGEYKDRLLKANVDFSTIEKTNSLYKELFNLTAQIDIDPKKVEESKRICAKSWTYLWEALAEIYQAGRFVFIDRPEIEELFYIDYRQEIGKSRQEPAKKEPAKEEELATAG